MQLIEIKQKKFGVPLPFSLIVTFKKTYTAISEQDNDVDTFKTESSSAMRIFLVTLL